MLVHGGLSHAGDWLPLAGLLPGYVVIPDRPGIGRSDPLEGRTLADWPKDVEALADAFQISSFAVVGVSAGGPSAAACAALIPGRLSGVALVSSMALAEYNWAERPGVEDGWSEEDRAEFDLAQKDPAAAAHLAAEHFADEFKLKMILAAR